ncbi:uncharacterized protein LOC129578693 [Sitodiplosis mosellana]|uniref:uncharacterized protein LOC129578693 n=1 Tax=Sitodiplosis mosellana TaxID=263140 RepID=UPI0024447D00|nr:uncharacterized protein LOC129578693 [Sitodiplosis mosellana]
MKFLILCVFALFVTCFAGKLRKTDYHSVGADEFGAGNAWADDEWGDEDWPSEPIKEWEHKPLKGWEPKPVKSWDEPLIVEKKVPVYVRVPVEHVRTVIKHHPVYIKEKNSPSIIIRKITHYNNHHH